MDDQQQFEWTGGCEDPRLAEREDGTFVVTFTQYTGPQKGGKVRLGLATSTNLTDWTKQGSPFVGTKYENLRMKSAAIVYGCADTFVGMAAAAWLPDQAAASNHGSN